MKTIESIFPAYSVAGGDKNFETIAYKGSNFLGVQIFYTSFSKGDNKIRLQESIDGAQYVDSKDANGNYIEIILATANASDMIKVDDFHAEYVRARFIEGTSGTGTISKINFLME